ncbi:MAG: TIGR03790 family protein [Planctomycetota bacterium]
MDIKRLIDDAQHPAQSGNVVLDATATTGQGNDWMATAAADLMAMGVPVIDTDPGIFLKNQPSIIAYCSWGSNDPSDAGPPYYGEVPPGSGNFYPGTFLTGCITTDYVSTSGRTFIDGNQNYGQSLTADLIRVGAAGGNGHVAEPYLDAVSRPHLLFRDYIEGFLVGEAYYQSFAYVHWMNVVVVDPLMKSGFIAGLPPQLNSISGPGTHAGGTTLTLSGKNFTNPATSSVTFEGTPSPSIDTASRTQMTALTPALEPGVYDVTVTTPFGSDTVADAYQALPVATLQGTPGIGNTISVTMVDQALDEYYLFLSLGTASLPLPPFGKLLLDPTVGFHIVAHGFFSFSSSYTLSGKIPDDPSLHGLTFYLQALLGPSVSAHNAYFTNRLDVAIP